VIRLELSFSLEAVKIEFPLPLPKPLLESEMRKSELLSAIQNEIYRHDFSQFVDEPPSVAQGGKGVVVPGCPMCKKRINTMPQFLHHLADDVLPPLLDRLSSGSKT
jgi:hypothetical protein